MNTRIKKLIKSKDGFVSIYTILWLTVLVPLLIFILINFTTMIKQKINYKNICDNAASSAVTHLNQVALTDGILEIRVSDAETIVKKIIARDLNLNDDLSLKPDSLITGKPVIETKIYNDIPQDGLTFSTKFGNSITITKPSVVVIGEFPVATSFKSAQGSTIKTYGVAQVQFNETTN